MASPSVQAATPTKPTKPDERPPAELFDEAFVVKLMKGKKVEATFTIHKGIAAFSSDYFKAALKKDTFKEGKNNCIEFKDIKNARAFGQLVGWMYTRKIDDYDDPRQIYLVDLWILADRFLVPFLGNAVINRIRDRSIASNILSQWVLKSSYKDMPEDSGFRKFAIDLFALSFTSSLGEECKKHNFSSEILCDLLTAHFKHRALHESHKCWSERVKTMDLCEYHSHKEGERCD